MPPNWWVVSLSPFHLPVGFPTSEIIMRTLVRKVGWGRQLLSIGSYKMSGNVFKPVHVFSPEQAFEEAPLFKIPNLELGKWKLRRRDRAHAITPELMLWTALCAVLPHLCTQQVSHMPHTHLDLLNTVTCLALPEHAWVFSSSFSSLC